MIKFAIASLAIAAAIIGNLLLALSQTQHWKKTQTTEPNPSPKLTRYLGFICYGVALAMLLVISSTFAALLWPLLLALTALLIVMVLSYKPTSLTTVTHALVRILKTAGRL